MGQRPAKVLTKFCELCSKQFEYKDKVINKNRKFCSGFCARSHNGKKNAGRTHSEEWICWAKKTFSGKNNPFYGKHHTEKTLKRLSALRRIPCQEHVKKLFSEKYSGAGNPFYGKSHTTETIDKLKSIANSPEGRAIRRRNIINLNKKRFIPNYNTDGCNLFEQINKELGWHGLHAENGGEYYIEELGYWVDYYEPNLNIVIEYDEPGHNLKKQQISDVQRENAIKEYLGCKFYRIKSTERNTWKTILEQNLESA